MKTTDVLCAFRTRDTDRTGAGVTLSWCPDCDVAWSTAEPLCWACGKAAADQPYHVPRYLSRAATGDVDASGRSARVDATG